MQSPRPSFPPESPERRDLSPMTARGRDSSGPAGLVADLQRPAAYPSPTPVGVELRATHGSWVFLTEKSAYKLKRPVDYGFLDYSTPDKRRYFCEVEVALGRRLAPDVYLGVEPVYLTAEGHRLFGPGQVVDHVVHMRRLADADAASALLDAEALGPAHLERLAVRLARFYRETPAHREIDAATILAAAIEENRRQALALGGVGLDPDAVGRVCAWQAASLRTRARILRERALAGRVRDGHGDLRLEHVYFEGGQAGEPLIIDAIEFNEGFRLADVALDVAFLAMELDAAGREELAAAFLSSFAARTDDYGFFVLLDLYLSYRAFVRAKVAGFVAADAGTPPAKARRKRQEAEWLLAHAESYTRRHRAQAVVLVGGLPGVGKTTLAAAVGRALALPVVSSDLVRKHLVGVDPETRARPEVYGAEWTERTYAGVLARARQVLDAGLGVVLDATFREPRWRLEAKDLAASAGRPFIFVEAACDEATVRERLRARGEVAHVSDADLAVYARLRDSFVPPDELPAVEKLRADTRLRPEVLAGQIVAHLGAARSDPAVTASLFQ